MAHRRAPVAAVAVWLTICRYEQAATSRVADAPEIDWDYYASQLPEYNMAEIKVRLVALRRCAVVCSATGRVSHILAHSPPRSPSSTPS